MKKSKQLFAVAIVAMMTACTAEEPFTTVDEQESYVETEEEETEDVAMFRTFAKILSKAAYGSPELRSFLKETAMKQIDNAYTVFYPLVKDEIVAGKTFHDILKEYDADNELETVEDALPLLNIHFPDFGLAKVKELDVQDEELPALVGKDIYLNGEIIDRLGDMEVPGYNIMQIDNSFSIGLSMSRGSASSNLLGGKYDYTDDIFNPAITKRTREDEPVSRSTTSGPYYDDPNPKYDEAGEVPIDEIDPVLINAYNVAKDDKNAQRYVMYYNLNSVSDKPVQLRGDIKEYIYRFKISGNFFRDVENTMNPSSDEQYFMYNYDATQKAPWTREQVLKALIRDKEMSFKFIFSSGASDTQLITENTIIKAYPQEVFNIAYNLIYTHSTGFRHSKYKYKIDKDKMKAKWYYIHEHSNSNGCIGRWDITREPLTRFLACYGMNPHTGENKHVVETISITTSKSSSLNASTDIDILVKVNLSGKIETNQTVVKTVTTEYDIVPKDLPLGKSGYHYMYDYPIETINTSTGKVAPCRISNTALEFTVLPMTNTFYQQLRSKYIE